MEELRFFRRNVTSEDLRRLSRKCETSEARKLSSVEMSLKIHNLGYIGVIFYVHSVPRIVAPINCACENGPEHPLMLVLRSSNCILTFMSYFFPKFLHVRNQFYQ